MSTNQQMLSMNMEELSLETNQQLKKDKENRKAQLILVNYDLKKKIKIKLILY